MVFYGHVIGIKLTSRGTLLETHRHGRRVAGDCNIARRWLTVALRVLVAVLIAAD